MNLADKIITLRKKQGWSQEELAERLEVSRQSVSKWEGGLSLPELDKIIAMSELFGVSTDYLLKNETEEPMPSEPSLQDEVPAIRAVSAEEADRYLAVVSRVAPRIALGVMLCVLSPVCLLFMMGCADESVAWITSEALAVSVGMIALFLLVGIAVALFIPNGLQLSEFSYLEKERISLAYDVRGTLEKRLSEYTPHFRARITVAIVLMVFSVLPMLIMGIMNVGALWLMGSLCLILIICSLAVAIIVQACYILGAYQRLLQTGEFSEKQKQIHQKSEVTEAAYWGIVTALYLGISFLTSAWHITWIAWPVAGCLFPLYNLIVNAIRGQR